jgi:hypothetical protein
MKCRFCKVPVRVETFSNSYDSHLRATCEQCGRVQVEVPQDVIRNRRRSCKNDEWMPITAKDAERLAEQEMKLLEWI